MQRIVPLSATQNITPRHALRYGQPCPSTARMPLITDQEAVTLHAPGPTRWQRRCWRMSWPHSSTSMICNLCPRKRLTSYPYPATDKSKGNYANGSEDSHQLPFIDSHVCFIGDRPCGLCRSIASAGKTSCGRRRGLLVRAL
jgi:hypothetical protein